VIKREVIVINAQVLWQYKQVATNGSIIPRFIARSSKEMTKTHPEEDDLRNDMDDGRLRQLSLFSRVKQVQRETALLVLEIEEVFLMVVAETAVDKTKI
jgi:hypothetical protein